MEIQSCSTNLKPKLKPPYIMEISLHFIITEKFNTFLVQIDMYGDPRNGIGFSLGKRANFPNLINGLNLFSALMVMSVRAILVIYYAHCNCGISSSEEGTILQQLSRF